MLIYHYLSGDEFLYNDISFDQRFRIPRLTINRCWVACDCVELFVGYNQSDSLYDNNGATSGSGNVQRQNGGVDFSGALKGNNNAYSESGDVIRQNGLIVAGDITIAEAQEILNLLINDLLVGLKSVLPIKLIDDLFNNIINVFETLIKKLLPLGSTTTTIIDVESTTIAGELLLDLNNEMTMIMVVDDIESDISLKEATIVLNSLL